MKKNQKGFGVVEVLITIAVIGLLIFAGWFMWHRHDMGQNSAYVPNQSGWRTYKSTISSAQFSYPNSWHLEKLDSDSFDLEHITLTSPNGVFQLDYQLYSHNLAASCEQTSYTTPVSVNDVYAIVPNLDYKNNKLIDEIYLTTNDYANNQLATVNCRLGVSVESATHNVGAIFSGSYIQNGNIVGKPAKSYFSLPEVKTTKTIFSSFKQ